METITHSPLTPTPRLQLPTALELLDTWARMEPDLCIKSHVSTEQSDTTYYRIVISHPIAHIIHPRPSNDAPSPSHDLGHRDLAMILCAITQQIERQAMRLSLYNTAEGWYATLCQDIPNSDQHVSYHSTAALAVLNVYLEFLSA